uniref:Growth arrest specific 7 n=1 Tax=Molossus molossus TaxID=27622 RepID=A0A7J8CXX8_MOLMO|nr:growth arrest specific 7 [Molossus molossus]
MVPPPPGEESQTVILPPGWQSYLSPQGRRYYVNTTTNETTWERPGSSPGIPASPGTQRSPVPPTGTVHVLLGGRQGAHTPSLGRSRLWTLGSETWLVILWTKPWEGPDREGGPLSLLPCRTQFPKASKSRR